MANDIYGISAYQQNTQAWKKAAARKEAVADKGAAVRRGAAKTETDGAQSAQSTAQVSSEISASGIKIKEWSPIDTSSSLVPKLTDDYGMAIGEVNLSDEAKDYYKTLKSKFHNADFILVSKDMKAQVQQNAAAYGNANKMVVLIDEEKIERMATDESFRKKYEGIIAMSQTQMANAKNSLASSGASIKNFGMSVNSDGSTDFFATLQKSSDDQAKRIEKKAQAKKEQKVKEKKKAEKHAREERMEKAREEQRAQKKEKNAKLSEDNFEEGVAQAEDTGEYVEIRGTSFEDLISKVQRYAYDNSARNIQTESERAVGQHLDLKW